MPAKRPGQALRIGHRTGRGPAAGPMVARRVRAVEGAWRWCGRTPGLAGLAAAVAALLVAAAVSATVAALQYRLIARQEERLRNEAKGRAETEAKAKEKAEASL